MAYPFSISAPLILAVFFFSHLLTTIVCYPLMFLRCHRHSTLGFVYLAWLILGFVDVLYDPSIIDALIYDGVLGILGIILTITAIADFQQRSTSQGTIDENITVSNSEMVEHAFYQGLNLVQILFLHCIHNRLHIFTRIWLLLLVTSPWLLRDYFPVNKFSDSSKKTGETTEFVNFLNRVKKIQYVFYKHFLLHGLNISIAVFGEAISKKKHFRLYWMLLNTSYIMHFFLQTLVKKKLMSQVYF